MITNKNPVFGVSMSVCYLIRFFMSLDAISLFDVCQANHLIKVLCNSAVPA